MIDRIEAIPRQAAAHHQRTGRPLITLTYAQSLDGSITAKRGTQLQISGPETKFFTHQLRAAHDAILIGIGTVLADNPKLTARRVMGRNPQPVVLDSHARLPLDCELMHHPTHRPIVAVLNEASEERIDTLERAGALILRLPADRENRISLNDFLDALGTRGITSLMVEGGAKVITSFLRARLVDQYILTVAPILVGGLRGVEDITSDPPQIEEMAVETMGRDLVVWGRPVWSDQ